MCKLISFLSGKGGSGKTTLALSIASMLSRCGVKVLLVDCDLSTNGATYFYEDRLAESKDIITSFSDFLHDPPPLNDSKFITISNNYDFMPSITQISQNSSYNYLPSENDVSFSLYSLRKKYDVILFDCQAGYTDLLKYILPSIDINLIVMEADAISSAALRSLFLKIGHLIKKKKVYQVFNKVGDEEYETYSKVSGGTLFTSIETVHFDWKIRKAFAVSQIPDMENTSANYGEQILSICLVLFRDSDIQRRLHLFRSILDYHRKDEEEQNALINLQSILHTYNSNRNEFFANVLLPLVLLIPLTFLMTTFLPDALTREENVLPLLAILCLLFFLVGSLVSFSRRSCASFLHSLHEKKKCQDTLNNITTQKDRLLRKIKKADQLSENDNDISSAP